MGCGDGAGGTEGVSALWLPGTRSRSPWHPRGTACLHTHCPRSGSGPQSCSSDTKLLVILHTLQAASHPGDFVAVSPLPGRHSLLPAQVNSSPPRAHWWDPDTHPAPACPPGSVTGVKPLSRGPVSCPVPAPSPVSALRQMAGHETQPDHSRLWVKFPKIPPRSPRPLRPPTAPTSPCAGPLPVRWLQAVPELP